MKRIVIELSHEDEKVESSVTKEIADCSMSIITNGKVRLHTFSERELRDTPMDILIPGFMIGGNSKESIRNQLRNVEEE